MKKSMLMYVAVATALASSGCATLQVTKDKVAATKKIAIVGYTGTVALDDGQEKSGLAGTIGAIKSNNDLLSGKLNARRIEQAEGGYGELAKRLETTFSVTVTGRDLLVQSPTFAQLLQKSPSTGVRVLGLQHLPDVLRAEVITQAKPAVRQTLVSELGVDALAAVKIRYEVGSRGGFAVAGMGKTTIFPRAVVEFSLYDAKGELIWHDFYARGEPTKEGLATTMGAEIVANETAVLTAALSSGYDALLQNYQTAK